MNEQQDGNEQIVVGRITAPHGVKGWVKIFSYTDPIERILEYAPWQIARGTSVRRLAVKAGRRQGKGIVVQPEGCEDRNQAELLKGFEIRIDKDRLPALAEGEFYWHQLERLAVVTTRGELLGEVDHLMETGANDVLVVEPTSSSIDERERLIPFVEDEVVREVDLDEGRITVAWDPQD